MTFVVTEACIKCKLTDCVEVCPVDCFHEGPNFLVIDPDECIDCTLCEPECPVEAIYSEDELPAGQEQFLELNAELSREWPVITEMKDPPEDADEWREVKDKLKQNGNSLSGGQQQRLCIARGIAIRPEVLLLDEPCSALDPISTARIEELINELKNDYTVVIVTHNMQQAARVSDFTGYMFLGELVEFDVTDSIFIKPKKRETEDYITGRFG